MRHVVLAAALAFRTLARPRGRLVPAATRRAGRFVMRWLDRRREIADARDQPDESELWSPAVQ